MVRALGLRVLVVVGLVLGLSGLTAASAPDRHGSLHDLIHAEAKAWRLAGHPEALHFPDNHLQPAIGEVVADQQYHHAAALFRAFGHTLGRKAKSLLAPFMPSEGSVRFHVFTTRCALARPRWRWVEASRTVGERTCRTGEGFAAGTTLTSAASRWT